jgi:putative ABC transport system permease protein
MLANNNKLIINKLVKNTIRTNKRQFVILFVTVVLSAFMLFSIFTVGLTYLELSRVQNTRLYGSECDVAIINGFTEEQKKIAAENAAVRSVGSQAYCGHVEGVDADDTVSAGLLWCDEAFWEIQKAPARTEMDGRYPRAENELLATREVLAACGLESLSVGDCFVMTYEDRVGIHTEEFVISGIWSGYGGDKANFYVSGEFYRRSGYDLESDGILQIKFKQDYVMGRTIETLKESLDLSPRQQFQPSDYIERSLTILLAVCGLCLVICLSAYLLVYNILYLSVSGKIRYYGLLQTLGMTKRQLVFFIRKQMLAVGSAGIAAGLVLGVFVSLFFVPHVMGILGISLGNVSVRFYPAVLVLGVLTTGIAILCGIRTPLYVATGVTPLEATKYRASGEAGLAGQEKNHVKLWKSGLEGSRGFHGGEEVKRGSLYWRMAKDQLKKDKKKTLIVFLSLATSFIVFYCLTTIVDSQGERTVYPNYWDADFIVQNATQTTEDVGSLRPAIGESFTSDIEKVEGVREVHAVLGIPVVFPYCDGSFADFWVKGYTELKPYLSYSETILDYQDSPEKYYGMLKGIGEAEFDYLNGVLGNTVDKGDFLAGRTAILQYAGFEIPQEWVGGKISFAAEDKTREITIGAVNYGDYYGVSTNVGANLIVSEEYVKTLTEKPYILSLTVKYERPYMEDTENAIKRLLEENPYNQDLLFVSKYDEMKTIQDSQGGMFEIGAVIAVLLLLVGMLNYVNTMASGMQSRKLTFSIMESVGMSRKQVRKLLVREGVLYAAGSIFIALTVGTAVTYVAFGSMNYMGVPFRIPVLPLSCAAVLVIVICVVTPLVTYGRLVRNRTIVERLREYE